MTTSSKLLAIKFEVHLLSVSKMGSSTHVLDSWGSEVGVKEESRAVPSMTKIKTLHQTCSKVG